MARGRQWWVGNAEAVSLAEAAEKQAEQIANLRRSLAREVAAVRDEHREVREAVE